MKILEVTAFSSGFCGLWARVKKESELLIEKGHEVVVFSSNIHRGSGKIEFAKEFEKIGKLKVHRFKTKGNFGENTFFWDYEKEAFRFKPDIIICHAYRQYYSTKAVKIAKKLGVPCILVTHAPFLEKKLRGWKLNAMVWFYDNFIGRRILNKYSRIFIITKWETPYLIELDVKKEKIVYMPNGVPEEFFNIKIPKPKNKKNKEILFLGRIAPIKDVETLIRAFSLVLEKEKSVVINFVGPIEEEYGLKIKDLIKKLKLDKKINFLGPVFDLKKKMNLIDSSDVFVLSSKREGMPQSLVEVMAREKIVISSDIQAGKEVIEDGNNGYLFKVGNENKLAEKILRGLKNSEENKKIRKNARKAVEKFSWNKLIDEIDEILKSLI